MIARLSAPIARDVAALTIDAVGVRKIVVGVDVIAKLF
jgi:hypothetical protein